MPGILPRAMADIFRRKAEMEHDYEVNIKTYMLELYNLMVEVIIVLCINAAGTEMQRQRHWKYYYPLICMPITGVCEVARCF